MVKMSLSLISVRILLSFQSKTLLYLGKMKGELLLLVPNVNLKANSSASLAMLSTRFYIYGALYCLTELLCAIKRHTLYKVLPIGPVNSPLSSQHHSVGTCACWHRIMCDKSDWLLSNFTTLPFKKNIPVILRCSIWYWYHINNVFNQFYDLIPRMQWEWCKRWMMFCLVYYSVLQA